MKNTVIFRIGVVALVIGAAGAAAGDFTEPRLGHILAPRRAECLNGAWLQTEAANLKHPCTGADGKASYTIEEVKFDPASPTNRWTACTVPRSFYVRNDLVDIWIKRDIFVRPGDETKRHVIHFEEIGETFAVVVNGHRFDGKPSFHIPQTVDISGSLKAGTNTVYVMFHKDGVRRQWKDSPIWPQARLGPAMPVHLECQGEVAVADVITAPQVTSGKVFRAEIVLKNVTAAARKVRVTAGVEGLWTEDAGEVAVPANGTASVKVEHPWPEARLWSPDDPHLYDLDVRVGDLDAFRRRFGFCEVRVEGPRILFNGHPVMARRGGLVKRGSDHSLKAGFAASRRDGATCARVFVVDRDAVRILDAADEAGFFITPVAAAGWGAAHRDQKTFWPIYTRHLVDMVEAFREHPSVLYWCASNEFGTIYGGKEGSPEEEPATIRQRAAQRQCTDTDLGRRRPWEACGEVELGYPIKGSPGPAPIRSYHYPITYCVAGRELPEAAYWYADSTILPWQQIATHDKPVSISEDLYHGIMDQHYGMARFAGDRIYTKAGYVEAMRWMGRTIAEGIYAGGITTWEPWCFSAGRAGNLLYDGSQVQSDHLVCLRDFNRTLFAGRAPERRLLYVYNQNFIARSKEIFLEAEYVFRGETTDVKCIPIPAEPGERLELDLPVPSPRTDVPERLIVRLKVRSGNSWDSDTLYSREEEFWVMPRVAAFEPGADCALVADRESAVVRRAAAWKVDRICASLDAALASGADRIVVAKPLAVSEGKALEAFVERGGRALLLEATVGGWAPAETAEKNPYSFAWRRNDERMRALDETMLRNWRTEGSPTMGPVSYEKGGEDGEILFDVGQKMGLTHYAVGWLYRRRGAYLLSALPVVSRFDIEPAAEWTLKCLVDEFASGGSVPARTAAVVDAPEYADFCRANGIALSDDPDASAALFTTNAPAAERALAKGRTVFLLEVTAADNAFLRRWGLEAFVPRMFRRAPSGAIYDDPSVNWFARKDNTGLMRGLSNQDFFWYNVNAVWNWGMRAYGGAAEGRVWGEAKAKKGPEMAGAHAVLRTLPGSSAELITDPAAIAVVRTGRGTLVISTARMSAHFKERGAEIARVLRTWANNCGCATSEPPEILEFEPVDIASQFNRNLWNDPQYKKADGTFDPVGWFGDENDMRFFPVNICGWSIASRAWCPRDPFPTAPAKYGPAVFRLTDPQENAGKACFVVMPGEERTLEFKEPVSTRRLWFMGAAGGWKACPVEVSYDGGETEKWDKGDQYNTFRWGGEVKTGRPAWLGYTLKDPGASMYAWPSAQLAKPVRKITFRNVSAEAPFALVAVSREK